MNKRSRWIVRAVLATTVTTLGVGTALAAREDAPASSPKTAPEPPAAAQPEQAEAPAPKVARADEERAPKLLRAPRLDTDWVPVFDGSSSRPAGVAGATLVAIAEEINAPTFRRTSLRTPFGRAWVGRTLAVTPLKGEPRCRNGGTWYQVAGGFVCDGLGWKVEEVVAAPTPDVQEPEPADPLPFRYAKVTTDAAPRLSRLPTPEEAARLVAGERPDDLVIEPMEGAYFLALHDEQQVGDKTFLRTVTDEYVAAEHTTAWDVPEMLGVHLSEEVQLPIAFVHGEEGAELFCGPQGERVPCGKAEHHARFVVEGEATERGERFVVGTDGVAVRADDVRMARKHALPADVKPGSKWVHIDLAEQVLTAYEGDKPVFTTLVSTGKGRYATPTGVFHTERKYMSRTMTGPDPDVGRYHIEQVPWVLYYHRGYAVHGAYWHNTFGNVRSHGCTNVAPADARWLYYWTETEVPAGLHGVIGAEGTYLVFTRDGKGA